MYLWLILVGIVILFLVLGLLWWGIKTGLILAVNSIIGFFALYAIQLVVPSLVIDAWSVLITAAFGIFGFAAVLILHFFHLAF